MKYCPHDRTELVPKTFEGQVLLRCPECSFVDWNGPSLVVATIIPKDDGLVMVKRKYPPAVGLYCLPCGFVDQHESANDAAIREPREETGLETKPNKLLGIFMPTPQKNQNIAVFVSRIVGGEMRPGSDSKAVGVFNRSNKPEMAFPFHEELFNAWFDGKIKLDDEDSVPRRL